jgi:hypothetical protein
MPKIDIELGGLNVRYLGEDAGIYREFVAQVKRVGSFAGELLGNTRVIRVSFDETSGLEPVNVEQGDPHSGSPVDYVSKVSDDRKARRIVSSAVKTAISNVQPQTVEDFPQLSLGMEN